MEASSANVVVGDDLWKSSSGKLVRRPDIRQSLLATFWILVVSLPAAAAISHSPPALYSTSGQFVFLQPVKPAPHTFFVGLDGAATNLGRFLGKVVVLNFWASWCSPCLAELPALDRLATAYPSGLAVIAISVDRGGAAVVTPFVASHHLTHLPVYLDPDQRLGSSSLSRATADALPLWGLPISYIIDKHGSVAGYIVGAARWDSPQAARFLDYFIHDPTP